MRGHLEEKLGKAIRPRLFILGTCVRTCFRMPSISTADGGRPPSFSGASGQGRVPLLASLLGFSPGHPLKWDVLLRTAPLWLPQKPTTGRQELPSFVTIIDVGRMRRRG